ncbi:MAG TPA: NAD(P)H-dependent oxidoreductase [Cyclobacteriaceae bacterium]|nr:NAD(P)H-dependent oxidoreductase [Cyclobacteriaceae bacterium]
MSHTITLICGTNRKDAISLHVTQFYEKLLKQLGCDTVLLDLTQLPQDFAFTALYENFGKNEAFNYYVDIMLKSERYVFIIPEYNGSFPGALKTFVDGLEYPHTFRNKKGALVGLASGGHGASLALSHFTDILNFRGLNILAYKPRLDHIEQYVENGVLTNAKYAQMLEKQAEMLVEF